MSYELIPDAFPPRRPNEKFEVLVHLQDLGDRGYFVDVKFPGSIRADITQQYMHLPDAIAFIRSMIESQRDRVHGARRA